MVRDLDESRERGELGAMREDCRPTSDTRFLKIGSEKNGVVTKFQPQRDCRVVWRHVFRCSRYRGGAREQGCDLTMCFGDTNLGG